MTQSTFIDAPAPWTLRGRGYIGLLRAPDALLESGSFIPASLKGKRRRSSHCQFMFVDYAESPVGPYHELLYIPGKFRFEDGKDHYSITRIFVSSMDSVVNGQRNWGIPKDIAEFDVQYGVDGVDRVRVSKNGVVFAELGFTQTPISMPFSSALLPRSFTTLGQHHDGRCYVYRPSAKGWIRPARLQSCRFDASEFPDLAQARPVMTVAVPDFTMIFHPSTLHALESVT